MTAELHEIFPIPIVKYYDILTNEQLKDIFDFLMSQENIFDNYYAFSGNAKSTFANHNQGVLHSIQKNVASCSNILDMIENINKSYSDLIGIDSDKICLEHSWANIQQKDSILMMHRHTGTLFSGALYINTDLNSSCLNFEDFFNYKSALYGESIIKHHNRFNYKNFWIKPRIGDLIIFPSLLNHGSNYERNQSDNRTVISYNICVR
jgi:uncharacterized protein (TIGR02466 family)